MHSEPITVERTFTIQPSKLWKILTDESEMKKWYFDIPGFKPNVGFEFRFYGGPEEGRQYLHICRVTEVIFERKLSYTWRYDGYPGNSLVTFEIENDNGEGRLTLKHEGLESFPQDNVDFNRVNFEAGWNQIIHESLAGYIEKDSVISLG